MDARSAWTPSVDAALSFLWTPALTTEATRALVQAFISCRLDYCNSVLAGVPDVYLQRLQSLQNAEARLVSGARRHDHITPVLVSLHWLSVRQRIIYKTAVLV